MSRSERRRLVATALGVSVLSFGVGWMLGRNGTSDTSAHAGEMTTEPTDGDAGDQGLSTLPSVDAEPPEPPEAPAGWSLSTTEVDPRAAATATRVLGVQRGSIIELDTATGQLASLPIAAQYDEPPHLDAGSGWFLVHRTDIPGAQLFTGEDVVPEVLEAGYSYNTFPEPGTDRFWRIMPSNEPVHGTRVIEVDHQTIATGIGYEIAGNNWPVGADPVGGVVVAGPGGSYHLGTDGSSQITTGGIVAISAATALISECTDDLRTCGLVVLDRSTGSTRPLTPRLPPAFGGAGAARVFESAGAYGFPSMLAAISPDGRRAPIVVSGNDLAFGVIDLGTGQFVELGDAPGSGWWWAPDGHAAMYIAGEQLMMYDFDEGSAFAVAPGVEMTAFAVRPDV
jgi:hypothetical protein